MSVTLQEVLKTDTLEIQRQKFNTLALDTFNVLAGGTNLNVGTIGIDDGTLSAPGLYFGNEPTLGLYRPAIYKMEFAVDNNSVMSIGDHAYNPLVGTSNPTVNVYKNLNSFAQNSISGFTFVGGSGYVEGNYVNVPLTNVSGTQGSGASANIEVSGLIGSITSFGSGYTPGNYTNVAFTNQSRPVSEFDGVINNGGLGYQGGSYTNVPLTGGIGTGAEATISVDGLTQQITGITITDFGDGLYEIGDVLGVDPAFDGTGNGSAFAFTVDEVIAVGAGALVTVIIDQY